MMTQLFEFFPVLLFFVAYKVYNIYVGTSVMMGATLLQVAIDYALHRKVSAMRWITLALVIIMGGATLYLHDVKYIKWKLSIIEWAFGIAFLGSQFIGEKPFVQRMMSSSLTLPPVIWKYLNLIWAAFFISVGFINLYVMYHYSDDDWVNFKTFGVPVLMIVFIVLQIAFLRKHIQNPEE